MIAKYVGIRQIYITQAITCSHTSPICHHDSQNNKRARDRGVALWLVGLNPQPLEMIQRSPLGETLGRERMHFNLETAVRKFQESAA